MNAPRTRMQRARDKFLSLGATFRAPPKPAVSDERIFNWIMNGRDIGGNMPAFGNKLNEKEINSLVTFVRGLKG